MMANFGDLWTTSQPRMHVLSDSTDLDSLRRSVPVSGGVVVKLDGGLMRTVEALFAEFVRELRFPEYFGWNWAAFAECITELSGCPARAYLLVIERADLLLGDSPADREIFFRLIKDVSSEWANSFGLGPEWDGGEVPFNVALLCSDEARMQLEGNAGCRR
ncbi:barstar family protein [Micromonospora sp. LOL_024]|uniref:barstar family protein n=1 Tax=Micromonospora sp. LOL_024 TaxID=3345412 RepID=UPI003A896D1E